MQSFLVSLFFVVLVFCQTARGGQMQSPEVLKDIEYGQAGGRSLLLDIGMPGGEQRRPGIILVHGGGWSSGDKQDMSFLFKPLNEAGFVCFSINYRLAPEFRWPACLEDVLTSVRWVKEHGPEYNADPQRLAIIGYSAGGHLACMAAVEAGESEGVAAVVGLAAPTDHEADSQRRGGLSPSLQKLLDRPKDIDDENRQVLRQISPITYIKPKLPPFFLIHGTADTSVPYAQSVNLQAKLQENRVPCELIALQGATHKIADWPADYQGKMVNWLCQTLAVQPQNTKMITVNNHGGGDFGSVQSAVDSIAEGNTERVVIAIEPGIYKERIVVPKSKRCIRFEGKEAETTVLTYHLNARMIGADGNEIGTFRTPSVTIEADDFSAENITFENSAGDVGQALAIAVMGDRAVFKNCRFLGWQDTIYDQAGRHYYENCYIAGHCDFIFGGGTAFFEKCRIHCLEGSYITAASTPQDEPYGYVFSNCTISGEPVRPKTYLGRPWRDYANVIFLNTQMEDVIRPEGWHNWSKPEREKTARYAEYNSTGPGGEPSARVLWSRQLTEDEVKGITVETVLKGRDGWNPLIVK
jgi:pectin methylesterase-like acyl-CoA thioesterase